MKVAPGPAGGTIGRRLDGRCAGETPAPEKNAAAVELGRLGGLKGGKARAKKLTPEQRSESARKAAQARWHPKES